MLELKTREEDGKVRRRKENDRARLEQGAFSVFLRSVYLPSLIRSRHILVLLLVLLGSK